MIKKITKQDFISEFGSWDTYRDKFTYDGLSALFEYLECAEDNGSNPVELDVVSITSDFTEYENLAELRLEYVNVRDMEHLEALTIVIHIENSTGTERFIIANL